MMSFEEDAIEEAYREVIKDQFAQLFATMSVSKDEPEAVKVAINFCRNGLVMARQTREVMTKLVKEL